MVNPCKVIKQMQCPDNTCLNDYADLYEHNTNRIGSIWTIDIREYIDCSLAQPTGLVLVELLYRQLLLSCGATIS